MAGSYTDDLGFRYKAKRNWPLTILAITATVLQGGAGIALGIGYPAIAGILTAYTVILFVIIIAFVIVPVYALDLFE